MRLAFPFGGSCLRQYHLGELPRLRYGQTRPSGPLATGALPQVNEDPRGGMTGVAESEPAYGYRQEPGRYYSRLRHTALDWPDSSATSLAAAISRKPLRTRYSGRPATSAISSAAADRRTAARIQRKYSEGHRSGTRRPPPATT